MIWFLFNYINLFINQGPALYVGCYIDDPSDRDLNIPSSNSTNKNIGGSIMSCVEFCIAQGKTDGLENGYDYAGVQNR